jgi:hypothetical protein
MKPFEPTTLRLPWRTLRRPMTRGCAWVVVALMLAACQQPQALPDRVSAPPLATAVSAAKAQDPAAARRGARLFRGEAPLAASLRGHDQVLPPDALRCSNCHVVDVPDSGLAGAALASATGPSAEPANSRSTAAAAVAAAAAAPMPLPPRLGAQPLQQPLRRRGGPPSAYTVDSFCRLLRTGVDPAQVVTSQAMPVYRISDADCFALWAFLLTPEPR